MQTCRETGKNETKGGRGSAIDSVVRASGVRKTGDNMRNGETRQRRQLNPGRIWGCGRNTKARGRKRRERIGVRLEIGRGYERLGGLERNGWMDRMGMQALHLVRLVTGSPGVMEGVPNGGWYWSRWAPPSVSPSVSTYLLPLYFLLLLPSYYPLSHSSPLLSLLLLLLSLLLFPNQCAWPHVYCYHKYLTTFQASI